MPALIAFSKKLFARSAGHFHSSRGVRGGKPIDSLAINPRRTALFQTFRKVSQTPHFRRSRHWHIRWDANTIVQVRANGLLKKLNVELTNFYRSRSTECDPGRQSRAEGACSHEETYRTP